MGELVAGSSSNCKHCSKHTWDWKTRRMILWAIEINECGALDMSQSALDRRFHLRTYMYLRTAPICTMSFLWIFAQIQVGEISRFWCTCSCASSKMTSSSSSPRAALICALELNHVTLIHFQHWPQWQRHAKAITCHNHGSIWKYP